MNPAIKELWVAGLRSGKYKQGKGSLRVKDKFCPLGVLCDIYISVGGAEFYRWRKSGTDDVAGWIGEPPGLMVTGLDKDFLPTEISKWAGLGHTCDPQIKIDEDGHDMATITISTLSDKIGYSFKKIAALIDKQF